MSGLNLDVKARRKNKAKINENYIEPENHSASNRFTRRQNNSQLQSQNKNYRRQDVYVVPFR
jgi:hypothetical protein